MRPRRLIMIIFLMVFSFTSALNSEARNKEIPLIIQVEGNPHEMIEKIQSEYPRVIIMEVFDLLFTGIALKIQVKDLKDFLQAPFITNHFPVQTYKPMQIKEDNHNFTQALPNIPYTGKGIKVGIIDTGIDYTHPELSSNYTGGYDLVDLDDDPMETLPEEGIATSHGTHVAGIIKSLATHTDIYAYRALGPGGQGSSIQVIAALERAVKDGMDIINLSLGNSINGPDFPSTIAVNKAVDLGVIVVIANGNDGPDQWTVGSPATASKALSVGAAEAAKNTPYLYDSLERRKIKLHKLQGSFPRRPYKDYQVVNSNHEIDDIKGKIVLLTKAGDDLYQQIKKLEEEDGLAILITEEEKESLMEIIRHKKFHLPIFMINKADKKWLYHKSKKKAYFISLQFKRQAESIPPFSSKGPVTGTWTIKPDLLAPGTNITSTIPGGYASYSGTSMAAPFVTGAIAIMKEAKPNWSNASIVQAIKTTAKPLQNEQGEKFPATGQGMGILQIEQALQAQVIIDDPLLSFGRLTKFKEEKSLSIRIKNNSNKQQKITFTPPKKEKGIHWSLPLAFSLQAQEEKTVPIELHATTSLLEEGSYEGWIPLSANGVEYFLPYLFVNKMDNYEKVMGFSIGEDPLQAGILTYQFYTTEALLSFQVDLFHSTSYFYKRKLLKVTDLPTGLFQGTIENLTDPLEGSYLALFTVTTEDGEVEIYEKELFF